MNYYFSKEGQKVLGQIISITSYWLLDRLNFSHISNKDVHHQMNKWSFTEQLKPPYLMPMQNTGNHLTYIWELLNKLCVNTQGNLTTDSRNHLVRALQSHLCLVFCTWMWRTACFKTAANWKQMNGPSAHAAMNTQGLLKRTQCVISFKGLPKAIICGRILKKNVVVLDWNWK